MAKKSKAAKLAKSAGIGRDTQALDALRRLLRESATIHETHRGAILSEDDPEHVHQARVALRRMRTLIRGFGDMLSPKTQRRIGELLKDRFKALGPLRDADVHAEALAGQPQSDKAAATAAELRRALRRDLAEDTGLSLKMQIETILHDTGTAIRGDRRQRLAQGPVGVIASRALHVAWTELLSFGADLNRLSPDDLHEFRKRAKDMRYLTEFFGTLFTEKPDHMMKRMAKMQDALGIVNDLQVMKARQHQDGMALPDDADRIEAKARQQSQKAWQKLRAEPVWWADLPA
ncbi:CHAD domain-containing protein [Paracoccus homiensis]|uniref:CHAD domain-containing protein n=1 Tax=Paracoccus homiensis TaxID=364199 RepID=UPI00398CE966